MGMKLTLVLLISLALVAFISVEALAQSEEQEGMTSVLLKAGVDTTGDRADVPILRESSRKKSCIPFGKKCTKGSTKCCDGIGIGGWHIEDPIGTCSNGVCRFKQKTV